MKSACPTRRAAGHSAREALLWQYDCLRCGMRFAVPVPSGPSQERLLQCPHCGGRSIARINDYILSDAFHGG